MIPRRTRALQASMRLGTPPLHERGEPVILGLDLVESSPES
jgi:hypothetical protein